MCDKAAYRGAVTSPQNIRIANRQARNRVREKNPDRRAEVRAWCKGKTCSCGSPLCGKPANTPHHPHDGLYGDEWGNLAECEPYYHHCHNLLHKGFERCPECGGWMRKGNDKCSRCKTEGKKWVRRPRITHTCGNCIGKQRCRRIGSDGRVRISICPHSSKKAESDCEHWKKREERK